MTPCHPDRPAFLLNAPFSFATDAPSHAWTPEPPASDGRVDLRRAMQQFFELYHFLSARSQLTILPTPLHTPFPELAFTSNLGFVPEHLAQKRIVILSQPSFPPPHSERTGGKRFFERLGYTAHRCPFPFRGEAELRYLYGNIYVGGYGQHTSRDAYEWMEAKFDVRIVKVKERNPYGQHLDCSIFPIDGAQTVVATYLFTPLELRELERVTEIIPVNRHFAVMGGCNSVMLDRFWLSGTIIGGLPRSHPSYRPEKEKNWALERIATRAGVTPHLFELSEFQKAGAHLSCLMMHLNRAGYRTRPFAQAAPQSLRSKSRHGPGAEAMPAQVA